MKQVDINNVAKALVTLISQNDFPVQAYELAQMVEEVPLPLAMAIEYFVEGN